MALPPLDVPTAWEAHPLLSRLDGLYTLHLQRDLNPSEGPEAWVEARQAERGARVLAEGGLVAFATETVYGLGAAAGNARAVERLFRVKGRPAWHPLIVHLPNSGALDEWALEASDDARRLAGRFWPGPLTLVVRKRPQVLDAVTGGQATVALRVPSHPLARRLLETFGEGVAAPSANRFGRVSPTTADHVRMDLGSDVDAVLDGGPCAIGVESTIVDATQERVQLLRQGGLAQEALEEFLGYPVREAVRSEVRVSGRLESHYAPRAEVILVEPSEAPARAEALYREGRRVILLSTGDVAPGKLYESLRKGDGSGVDVIVAPLPPDEGLGRAVRDRLRKAAAPRRPTS